MSSDLQRIGWEGQLTIWIWNFLKMDSKDATSNVIFQVSWKHKKIFFKLPWPKLKENQGLAKPPIPLVYSCACNFFILQRKYSFLWNLTRSCRGKRTLWAVIKRTLSQNKFFHKDERAGWYEKGGEQAMSPLHDFFCKIYHKTTLFFCYCVLLLCSHFTISNEIKRVQCWIWVAWVVHELQQIVAWKGSNLAIRLCSKVIGWVAKWKVQNPFIILAAHDSRDRKGNFKNDNASTWSGSEACVKRIK